MSRALKRAARNTVAYGTAGLIVAGTVVITLASLALPVVLVWYLLTH